MGSIISVFILNNEARWHTLYRILCVQLCILSACVIFRKTVIRKKPNFKWVFAVVGTFEVAFISFIETIIFEISGLNTFMISFFLTAIFYYIVDSFDLLCPSSILLNSAPTAPIGILHSNNSKHSKEKLSTSDHNTSHHKRELTKKESLEKGQFRHQKRVTWSDKLLDNFNRCLLTVIFYPLLSFLMSAVLSPEFSSDDFNCLISLNGNDKNPITALIFFLTFFLEFFGAFLVETLMTQDDRLKCISKITLDSIFKLISTSLLFLFGLPIIRVQMAPYIGLLYIWGSCESQEKFSYLIMHNLASLLGIMAAYFWYQKPDLDIQPSLQKLEKQNLGDGKRPSKKDLSREKMKQYQHHRKNLNNPESWHCQDKCRWICNEPYSHMPVNNNSRQNHHVPNWSKQHGASETCTEDDNETNLSIDVVDNGFSSNSPNYSCRHRYSSASSEEPSFPYTKNNKPHFIQKKPLPVKRYSDTSLATPRVLPVKNKPYKGSKGLKRFSNSSTRQFSDCKVHQHGFRRSKNRNGRKNNCFVDELKDSDEESCFDNDGQKSINDFITDSHVMKDSHMMKDFSNRHRCQQTSLAESDINYVKMLRETDKKSNVLPKLKEQYKKIPKRSKIRAVDSYSTDPMLPKYFYSNVEAPFNSFQTPNKNCSSTASKRLSGGKKKCSFEQFSPKRYSPKKYSPLKFPLKRSPPKMYLSKRQNLGQYYNEQNCETNYGYSRSALNGSFSNSKHKSNKENKRLLKLNHSPKVFCMMNENKSAKVYKKPNFNLNSDDENWEGGVYMPKSNHNSADQMSYKFGRKTQRNPCKFKVKIPAGPPNLSIPNHAHKNNPTSSNRYCNSRYQHQRRIPSYCQRHLSTPILHPQWKNNVCSSDSSSSTSLATSLSSSSLSLNENKDSYPVNNFFHNRNRSSNRADVDSDNRWPYCRCCVSSPITNYSNKFMPTSTNMNNKQTNGCCYNGAVKQDSRDATNSNLCNKFTPNYGVTKNRHNFENAENTSLYTNSPNRFETVPIQSAQRQMKVCFENPHLDQRSPCYSDSRILLRPLENRDATYDKNDYGIGNRYYYE